MTLHNDPEAFGGYLANVCGSTFPIVLRSGLALVGHVNSVGGVEALHDNPICMAAAVAMAAELRAEPSPTDDFAAIAEAHELRARILAALPNDLPEDAAERVATKLASIQPWTTCGQPEPFEHDELQF